MSSNLKTAFAPGRPGIGLFAAVLALALYSCDSRVSSAKEDRQPMLQMERGPLPERAPGEYIVTMAPGAGKDLLRQQYSAYGIREIVDLGANMFLLKLSQDPGADELMRKGMASGKVKAVQQNYIYRANK